LPHDTFDGPVVADADRFDPRVWVLVAADAVRLEAE